MDRKIGVLYGMVIGMVLGAIGVVLFLTIATDYSLEYGITTLIENGSLNKIIALGELLNVPLFFLLLNKHKYYMARGILLQALLFTIVSLFI